MFILIAIATFFLTEFIAWFSHKYIMHKFLWNLHKDHHDKKHKYRFIEDNDAFFLIFATPAIILIILGSTQNNYSFISIGVGLTIYGVCYFIVHDIFIHQRIKWFKKSNNIYLKAIRRAHKMHHKNLQKEGGECFGLLFFPKKYLIDELKKN